MKNYNRWSGLFLMICVVLLFLSGCKCRHEWIAATCTEPETCSKCGEIQGEPLGHIPGEWIVTKSATLATPGEQARVCTTCGEELETRKFELTDGMAGVEAAYFVATNLTVEDLTKKENVLGTWYYYKDIQLLTKDCEWIENPLNTRGTVDCSALYMKMAVLLDAFGLGREGGNDWTSYAEWLIGFTPNTRNEFVPYVENAITFITSSHTLKNVMEKFESLGCIEGSFDFSNKKFSFNVPDLAACANEMEISEEMLGYIFAMLNNYGAVTTFNGNSCTFSYEALFDFEY